MCKIHQRGGSNQLLLHVLMFSVNVLSAAAAAAAEEGPAGSPAPAAAGWPGLSWPNNTHAQAARWVGAVWR
jgi:hypothetical protein